MKKQKRNKPAPIPKETLTGEATELKKVSIHINSFGEIVRDVKTDDINAFLNEHVPDKKFTEE